MSKQAVEVLSAEYMLQHWALVFDDDAVVDTLDCKAFSMQKAASKVG